MNEVKLLVMGWFSFSDGHFTAGDILSKDLLCEWLNTAGFKYDVALDPPYSGGVDWKVVNPEDYSHIIFVCGPFGNDELETQFLNKFHPHCRIIGLNLSMKIPLSEFNPFDFLIERNSSRNTNPDLVFASHTKRVPLLGVCLVEEYDGAMVQELNQVVSEFLKTQSAAIIYIDSRLDLNSSGLRSPEEIETLISKVDVLITSRLHGLVLALKNGIPVIAIDPERGGSKICRQCEALNWHAVTTADIVNIPELEKMLDYCLSSKAKADALETSISAAQRVNRIREILISTLIDGRIIDESFSKRMPELIQEKLSKNVQKKPLLKNLRSSLRKYFF